MPLETATYISQLVAANPAHSDGLNQSDAHARLIKSTLQTSFPNIAGAVTASHTQLNSLLSQLLGTTVYTSPLGAVGAPSYSFLGDTDTGWYSPAANRAALSLGGADALNFAADKTANFAAGISAVGPITGPGATPVGGMIMWLTDTLPTANGVWAWANGGTLSRTTPGAGLELFNVWGGAGGGGTRYGVGDGSTTFNVINMQEVVPVGKSTMGGATSPGLLASIAAGIKGVLNGFFGSDTHTLTAAEIPSITSRNPTQAIVVTATSTAYANGSTAGCAPGSTVVASGGGYINLSSNGSADITVTSNNTGGGAHSITQPSRAVNFIIRIA